MTTNSMAYNRTLFLEDNLPVLRGLDSKSIDLIATDPPFNKGVGAFRGTTKAGQNVEFKDVWHWSQVQDEWLEQLEGEHPNLFNMIRYANSAVGTDEKGSSMGAFICWMAVRVLEMHRVLKDTGSMYLHCDPKASHYLKAMMDAIFGQKNFRNEIVWQYDGPQGPSKGDFATKHDIILRYTKTIQYDANTRALYPIQESELRQKYRQSKDGRWFYDLPKGNYTEESIARLEKEGRVRRTRTGNVRIVYYLHQSSDGTVFREKAIPDVWSDIPSLGQSGLASEKTGWPTQKPLALYKRMIEASSNPGDIVLDPFAGCATTCVAAEQMERKWIGVDLDNEAGQVIVERLQREVNASMAWDKFVNVQHAPPVRTDDGEPAAPELILESPKKNEPKMSKKEAKVKLIEIYGMRCQGCGWVPPYADHLEVDHKKARNKKGKETLRNFGLLCGPCNKRKREKYTTPELQQIRIEEGRMDMEWWEDEGKH